MEIGQGLQMASMCGNNKIHIHIPTYGFGVVLISHPIQTSNVKNTYLDHCISWHSFEIQRNELNYSLFCELEFKLEVYE